MVTKNYETTLKIASIPPTNVTLLDRLDSIFHFSSNLNTELGGRGKIKLVTHLKIKVVYERAQQKTNKLLKSRILTLPESWCKSIMTFPVFISSKTSTFTDLKSSNTDRFSRPSENPAPNTILITQIKLKKNYDFY